jgi:hypothetical protein
MNCKSAARMLPMSWLSLAKGLIVRDELQAGIAGAVQKAGRIRDELAQRIPGADRLFQ